MCPQLRMLGSTSTFQWDITRCWCASYKSCLHCSQNVQLCWTRLHSSGCIASSLAGVGVRGLAAASFVVAPDWSVLNPPMRLWGTSCLFWVHLGTFPFFPDYFCIKVFCASSKVGACQHCWFAWMIHPTLPWMVVTGFHILQAGSTETPHSSRILILILNVIIHRYTQLHLIFHMILWCL